MNLSRLDEAAGDMKNLEMVELKKLAENTVQRLQAQAAGKNITVSVSGCEVEVEGVPAILGEVIYNLIDNGIKYNRDGGRFDVTVAIVPGEAVLTFKDTGCGIGSADKERVFERFYRVDKSHFKETGGTGLGLSIVKHGILFHQGRIELESELEQGTTIKIFLPRK